MNLDKLTKSIDKTGGIERALDFVFFSMTAINGFDDIGHYLRAALNVNLCTPYAIDTAAGCNANFTDTRAIASGGRRSRHTEARIAREPAETSGRPRAACRPTGNVLGGILGTAGR